MNVSLLDHLRTIERRIAEAPTKECRVYATALAALEEIARQDPSIDIRKLKVDTEAKLAKCKMELIAEFKKEMKRLKVRVSERDLRFDRCRLYGNLKHLSAAEKIHAVEAVSKLIFLRTLNLADNGLTILPDIFDKLAFLQNLILIGTRADPPKGLSCNIYQ